MRTPHTHTRTRTLPLPRTAAAAASLGLGLALAGTLTALPGPAQAAVPHAAAAESSGHGLNSFQERHGLSRTGVVDGATARALHRASDAELLRTFRTAADLGPEELGRSPTYPPRPSPSTEWHPSAAIRD